jgi:uncharacterized glyoxalase superfamily protein PhnB
MSSDPTVIPMLTYEDGVAALEWLARAFGFRELTKRHREHCERARKWASVPWIIDGVLVMVDNLDAHFAQAKASGAVILSAIEDGPPAHRYRAEDLEGHRWFFMER